MLFWVGLAVFVAVAEGLGSVSNRLVVLLQSTQEDAEIDVLLRFPALKRNQMQVEFGQVLLRLADAHKVRGVRRELVARTLRKHAAETQQETLRMLREFGVEHRSFWINNR